MLSVITTPRAYRPHMSANTDVERPSPPQPLGPPPVLRRTRPPPYRPPMFPQSHITQERRSTNDSVLYDSEQDYVRRRITFENITDEEVEVLNNFDGRINLPKCDADCECTICLSDDNTNNDMGKLPCGHTFHTNCITQWFMKNKTTCPNCRTIINIETLFSN
jgi:hypothetical protein